MATHVIRHGNFLNNFLEFFTVLRVFQCNKKKIKLTFRKKYMFFPESERRYIRLKSISYRAIILPYNRKVPYF